MTFALTLIKGKSTQREPSINLLTQLSKDRTFAEENGVTIENVFISFGWPDMILLLKGNNVELIKNSIVVIRNKLASNGDDVDTSTIICTTQDEINQQLRDWAKSKERKRKIETSPT
jgi:hypothetical protein